MAVDIALAQDTLTTGTGTKNVTKSGFGTPKAKFYLSTYATALGTPADDAGLAIGGASGVSNQFALFLSDEHGQSASDTHRDNDAAIANHTVPGASTQDGLAVLDAFITDGSRINVTNGFAAAYQMIAAMFGGSDLTAVCGQVDLGNTGLNTVNVTALGSRADVIIGWHTVDNTAGSSILKTTLGIAAWNGASYDQICVGFEWDNGVNPAACAGELMDDRLIFEQFSSSSGYEFAVSSHASGFTLTEQVNVAASNDLWNYIAFNFNGAVTAKVGMYTTPTATGNNSNTTPGITPQFVMHILTAFTAVNTQRFDSTGNEAGVMGYSLMTADDEYSVALAAENDANPTNTQSLVSSQAVDMAGHNGTTLAAASYVSFDSSSGYTWNFSTAPGTALKWPFLVIEANSSGTAYTQSVAGAIDFAGNVAKKTKKPLSGGADFAGVVARKTSKALAGAVDFVGSAVKKSSKALSGAVDFVGSVTKKTLKPLQGALSSAGALTKKAAPLLQGALSFVGTVAKKTAVSYSGSVSFVGSLAKKTLKPLQGTIDFVGTLTQRIIYTLSLAGSIGFSGDLSKKTGKSLAGVVDFAGDLTRKTAKQLSGAVDFAGNIAKKTAKTLAGALDFVGTFTQKIVFTITLQGSIGFSGDVSKKTGKALQGSIDFAGGLIKKTVTILQGALSFSGSVARKTAVTLQGALSSSGIVAKKTARSLAGSLSFVGTIAKKTRKALQGIIDFAGSVVTQFTGGGLVTTPKQLTLRERNNTLTLENRTNQLSLYERSNNLTLEDRD